ncbi:MAG: hypothetical protein Q7S61_01240 [bacterium]|nr:hypothetical protein [bacterium]
MRPNDQLFAIVKGEVVTLSMFNHGSLYFLGSSAKCALKPGEVSSNISIALDQGKCAIVMVRAMEGAGSRNYKDSTYTIHIKWLQDKEVYADLGNHFVPPADRIFKLDSDGSICVYTDDQAFTFLSSSYDEQHRKVMSSGEKPHRLVDNPNLLCRYLVHQATLADLEAAATLDKRGQLERDLAKEQNELRKAIAKLTLVSAELADCRSKLGDQVQACKESEQQLATITRHYDDVYRELGIVGNQVNTYEASFIDIWRTLNNSGPQKSIWNWWSRARRLSATKYFVKHNLTPLSIGIK